MESHFSVLRSSPTFKGKSSMRVCFRVGEGNNVCFLFDDWVGIGQLWYVFRMLFRVASNKK